jgi:hypothetical protein
LRCAQRVRGDHVKFHGRGQLARALGISEQEVDPLFLDLDVTGSPDLRARDRLMEAALAYGRSSDADLGRRAMALRGAAVALTRLVDKSR